MKKQLAAMMAMGMGMALSSREFDSPHASRAYDIPQADDDTKRRILEDNRRRQAEKAARRQHRFNQDEANVLRINARIKQEKKAAAIAKGKATKLRKKQEAAAAKIN